MKTKSNCAPDGSVMLANEHERNTILITWYLDWDMIRLYLVNNYFHFFIHVFVPSDVMFHTVVCEFKILCEEEIL